MTDPSASPRSPEGLYPESEGLPGRLMIAVALLAVAGACWLISAGQGTEEGHIPWRSGSVLKFITTLMTLNFLYPTRQGVEIKWLVQGLAAAAAVCLAVAAWYARWRERVAREDVEGSAEEVKTSSLIPISSAAESAGPAVFRFSPGSWAMYAFLALAGWSMASALWAHWPEVALGEGIRLAGGVLLSAALAWTLRPHQARQVAWGMAVILALTAALGIWYYYERNPYQRLKFPIGNPIFLASCLLPGITIALGGVAATVVGMFRPRQPGRPAELATGGPRRLWAGILCLLCLPVFGWALKLTASRGPQIGLVVGVVIAVLVMLRDRRRQVGLLIVLVVLLIGVVRVQVFGYPAFIAQRMETVLLRVHAWSYAWQLFAQRPLLGQGQAGYVLGAQQMAVVDAQFAPLVFPGQLMGHAHNEWLEILADLGLVGFALAAGGLTLTFWCAARAVHRAAGPQERFTALGLLAGFVALVFAEATDVGLRMPGLPVVFHVLLGCLWALEGNMAAGGHNLKKPLRGIFQWPAMGGAVFAGLVAGLTALADWRAALADRASVGLLERGQFDPALLKADQACGLRLAVEGRLSAEYQFNLSAYLAARHRFGQMRDMLARHQAGAVPGENVASLAAEDLAAIESYVRLCVGRGVLLLSRIPGYPEVAGRAGESLLLMQDAVTLAARAGLEVPPVDHLARARELIALEYQRDPLDPEIAVRLVQLSSDRPVLERLSLLVPPLRRGPVGLDHPPEQPAMIDEELAIDLFGEYEWILAELLGEKDLEEALNALVREAEEAFASNQPERCLHEYVPEVFRLAARLRRMQRAFEVAVELGRRAVEASAPIREAFPVAVSNAWLDLSGVLVPAFPDQPALAVDAGRQALLAIGGPRPERRRLRLTRHLAWLQLVAGDEAAARQTLAGTLPTEYPPELLDRLVAQGLLEVCHNLLDVWPPDHRPPWWGDRLQRVAALLPDHPQVVMLEAMDAFDRGQAAAALEHLDRLVRSMPDTEALAGVWEYLLKRYPDQPDLRTYIQRWQAAGRSATQTAPVEEGVQAAPSPPLP